jgi:hypothetical protein
MTPPGRTLRLPCEPLLGFAALGALIFALHALTKKPDPRTIVVPRGLRGDALEAFELEQAAHREALALGLGRDDPQVLAILKQRLVSARSTPTRDPSEADLVRWLESHRDAFELPERFDFDHVFFDSSRPDPEARARALLSKLEPGGAAPSAGDPFRFGNSLRNESLPRVRSVFGSDFAERLRTAELGSWQLAKSLEGLHLVRVLARREAALPPLEDVRGALTDAWKRAHEATLDRQILSDLVKQYRFVEEP